MTSDQIDALCRQVALAAIKGSEKSIEQSIQRSKAAGKTSREALMDVKHNVMEPDWDKAFEGAQRPNVAHISGRAAGVMRHIYVELKLRVLAAYERPIRYAYRGKQTRGR